MGAVAGLAVSILTLGYAIPATVVGTVPEFPQHWGCMYQDSLTYCNQTDSGYQCGNTESAGNMAFCISQAKIQNPTWAQGLQTSGIVLDVLAFFSTIVFSMATYTVFKGSCCASSTVEPSSV